SPSSSTRYLRSLLSFPTRRSSDLICQCPASWVTRRLPRAGRLTRLSTWVSSDLGLLSISRNLTAVAPLPRPSLNTTRIILCYCLPVVSRRRAGLLLSAGSSLLSPFSVNTTSSLHPARVSTSALSTLGNTLPRTRPSSDGV